VECRLRVVEPTVERLFRLAQHPCQSGFDAVGVQIEGVTLINPLGSSDIAIGRMKTAEFAFGIEHPLHVRDVRMIGTVAQHLVEDVEKDSEDRVFLASVRLAVDVEEDDISIGVHRALDVSSKHGIGDLAIEKLDGALGLAVLRHLSV